MKVTVHLLAPFGSNFMGYMIDEVGKFTDAFPAYLKTKGINDLELTLNPIAFYLYSLKGLPGDVGAGEERCFLRSLGLNPEEYHHFVLLGWSETFGPNETPLWGYALEHSSYSRADTEAELMARYGNWIASATVSSNGIEQRATSYYWRASAIPYVSHEILHLHPIDDRIRLDGDEWFQKFDPFEYQGRRYLFQALP